MHDEATERLNNAAEIYGEDFSQLDDLSNDLLNHGSDILNHSIDFDVSMTLNDEQKEINENQTKKVAVEMPKIDHMTVDELVNHLIERKKRQIFEAKKKKLPWDEQQELERAYKADHSDDLDTDDSIDAEDAVDKFTGLLKKHQDKLRKR